MEDWKNTSVIPCLDRTGKRITVIEQTQKNLAQTERLSDDGPGRKQRYVLGNGLHVRLLDTDRFELPGSHEIVCRR